MSILLRTMMAQMAKPVLIQAATSGTLYIATKDGEAMFFHDSIDFSAYAGTDAGSTPYRFIFTDAAGKKASAYGGDVGGGEALGEEMLGNTTFEDTTKIVTVSCTVASVAGGEAGNCIELTRTDGTYQYFGIKNPSDMFIQFLAGRLYKASFSLKSGTSGNENAQANIAGENSLCSVTSTGSWVSHAGYGTKGAAASGFFYLRKASATAGTMLFDTASLKSLTDIPATGLHLMSAKGGTTRNMLVTESGFNPNTITGVWVFRS